ncbi:MAG: hypothetical protein C0601_10765 [Candidatus Muiribacterium halophilum]|uniref:4Fe-4S ferredoxin-type domain-containing protein n=1 Tax=Muiribacterium halophilum TaxID=2053465 RepID=A0A2N5ZBQ8_MUIH1|nr:MAG: hypothetical protein C0601_10765 [Candidatus Muirbacterium halophilum]
MEKVILKDSPYYNREDIFVKVNEIFEETGFYKNVSKEDRIFLKVNLLTAASPDKAVCTNPVFVDAVIKVLLKNGYKRLECGDSPGIGSPEKVAKASGIYDILKQNNVSFVSIENEKRFKTPKAHRRKYINLFNGIDEIDTLVNLPKLKTHCLMTMTLGVKNLYGLLPGKANKVDGHMKENTTEKFAFYLKDIFETVSSKVKVFTLIDGITGMEGDGPGNGLPVNTGIVAGSFDSESLDYFLLRWCGLSLNEYPLFLIAENKEEIKNSTDKLIEKYGTFKRVIKRPKKGDVTFNIPLFLRKIYERFFYSYTKIDDKKCKRCGICKKSCPVDAIKIRKKIFSIVKKRCIRCFCCHELCPHDAVLIKQTLPLAILKKFVNIFQRITGI